MESALVRRLGQSRIGSRVRSEVLDALDRVRGRRDPLTPPRRLLLVGEGDFRKRGLEFRDHFKSAGLQPSNRVLDVGCGIGRMAVALTDFPVKSYCGFDVNGRWIEWCQKQIASRYENFSFQHLDVANPRYNPGGRLDPCELRFPFQDRSFDFAIATSVFTHMRPSETSHYLAEIRRVLESRAVCFSTFFLLNEESRGLLDAGRARPDLNFKHQLDGQLLTLNRETPESGIAVPEDWVRGQLIERGFELEEIHYGSWCGRDRYVSLQDIVVARVADR